MLISMLTTEKQQGVFHNQFIGRIGESEACKILKSLGHTILRRNYENRYGEIDIISFDKNKTLCFFEVKTILRKGRESTIHSPHPLPYDQSHHAEDNLSKKKIKNMMRAVEPYINNFPVENPYWEAHGITLELDHELICKKYEIIPHINIEVS